MIEFLTLENVPAQRIHNNRLMVVYGENAPSYATATVKRWAVEFRPGRNVLKMTPGQDAHLMLSVKKTITLWKICYEKPQSHCAPGS